MRMRSVAMALASCALAVSTPARAQLGDIRIDHPVVDGAPIDWCQSWGRGCGWAGAHAFCQERGYPRATHFELYNPGRSFIVGGNEFCTGPACTAFLSVTCMMAKPADPSAVPPLAAVPPPYIPSPEDDD